MNSLTIPNEEKKGIENEMATIANNITELDKNILGQMANIYTSLTKEPMDINAVNDSVDALARFNNKQEYKYLNNLLCPEKNKGVKVPSPLPVPSCSFQLHNSITLTPNTNGYLNVILNPFFLASSTALTADQIYPTATFDYLTSLWVNHDPLLDGTTINNAYIPQNLNQVIPGVYEQYRLVSAAVTVKYIGRLDNVSGTIGGAIVFDETPYIGGLYRTSSGATYTQNPDLTKYSNFDLAIDSFYHQENMAVEGLRMLYFPIDNSYEEYVKIMDGTNVTNADSNILFKADEDYLKSGFNFNIYTRNAPGGVACFQLDLYANFECLPNAQFLNYMPISLNTSFVDSYNKKKAIVTVQQKPIMKASEGGEQLTWKSAMKSFADKFGGKIPSITKFISSNLLGPLSLFKTGLSLAGSMYQMLNNNN